MKKILVILSLLCLSFLPVPPTPTYVYIGDKITSAGTSDIELQFYNSTVMYSGPQLIYIIVDSGNSGTIQFSVGVSVQSSAQPYAAGSRVPMTIYNGVQNLHYKASGASQSFSVTM